MRKRTIAAALAVLGVALINVGGADAAPIEASVRVEGIERTLFEGPIVTDGHDVQAASEAEPHFCDGTNGEPEPQPPGPTPTAAAVDALGLVGEDWDGTWFSGFDDFGVERLGPDSQDFEFGEFGAFWGVNVNWALIAVGGCQYRAVAGDQVLWAWDGFSERGLLRLAAAADPSVAPAAPAATASVEVGQPLALEVESLSGGEGEAVTAAAAAGVTVAPVDTEPGAGFQTVKTGDPLAEETDGGGNAEVTFPTPGWHRLKAQEDPTFIRSNRLDVCVEPVGGGGCGAPPADSLLRVPARYAPPGGGAGAPGGGAPAVTLPGVHLPALQGRKPFALRGLRLRRGKGTATLKVRVPGAGRLVVFGRRVVRVRRGAKRAGIVRVTIRAKRRLRARLARRGRLRVRVKVGFRLRGGKARFKTRRLTLRHRPGHG